VSNKACSVAVIAVTAVPAAEVKKKTGSGFRVHAIFVEWRDRRVISYINPNAATIGCKIGTSSQNQPPVRLGSRHDRRQPFLGLGPTPVDRKSRIWFEVHWSTQAGRCMAAALEPCIFH
jgi:hypothetical protein